MTRRIALAAALALTVIVGFALLAIGSSAGYFGGKHREQPASAVQEAGEDTGLSQASAEPDSIPDPPAAPLAPEFKTTYVYVDEPQPSGPGTGSQGSTVSAPTPRPSTNTAPPPSATPTPPSRQSQANPSPATSTPYFAPSATRQPPTSTRPPATPSPSTQGTTTPARTPTRTATMSMPSELEFSSTVSSISGDMVTFANGRTVRVSSGLSQLHVGTKAHVHARLQGGIYVATEVEVNN